MYASRNGPISSLLVSGHTNMVGIFYYKPHSYGVKTSTCLQNDEDMKHDSYLEIHCMFVSPMKLKVVGLAEKSNNSAASCKFSVSEKHVRLAETF